MNIYGYIQNHSVNDLNVHQIFYFLVKKFAHSTKEIREFVKKALFLLVLETTLKNCENNYLDNPDSSLKANNKAFIMKFYLGMEALLLLLSKMFHSS